jgi:hypothetical protein
MFYAVLCDEYGNNNEEILKNEIEKLEQYIDIQKKENENILKQEPFCFENNLNDEK